MPDPVCPETGAPMHRAVRPLTLTYKGDSITVDMPGWYCDQSEASIHTGEDMKVSDRALTGSRPAQAGCLSPRRSGASAGSLASARRQPANSSAAVHAPFRNLRPETWCQAAPSAVH